MQHNGWDHALKVTADGTGLVGHAGAVTLRKAADQAGLTGQFSAALREKGTSPLLDRRIVLVSLAAAIALAPQLAQPAAAQAINLGRGADRADMSPPRTRGGRVQSR